MARVCAQAGDDANFASYLHRPLAGDGA